MQTTQSLIFEYARTRVETKEANRCRKRLRKRAKNGDKIAQRFLATSFPPTKSLAKLRTMLIEWFNK